jgi:hypothetical protein
VLALLNLVGILCGERCDPSRALSCQLRRERVAIQLQQAKELFPQRAQPGLVWPNFDGRLGLVRPSKTVLNK